MARFRKKADIELGDGGIDDVRKVIASLSKEDRERILARGRTEYRDIPTRLAGRSVAYDKGTPVGFSDIWGLYDDGRVRPSPSITVAVSEGHRGRGIAGRVTKDAIRKVLDRVDKLRNEQGGNADRLKRFVWRLHAGNDSSARAAEKTGFKEQSFSRPHNFRQFVMSREDAEKTASSPDRNRIRSQYARHPQESLDRLATRLAKRKWSKSDIVREDSAHADEFGATGEDKEFLDRYIIARIAESYDRRAKVKQALLRAAWEKRHGGESFDDALPIRMARFRQYEDVPFGVYDNDLEQERFMNDFHAKDESAWEKYLSDTLGEKKADARPSKEDLWRMYDIVQADARLAKKVEGLGFGRNGDAYRRAAIKLKVMELARVLQDGKKIRNNIAHRPGYIPSEQDANRALRQYADAEAKLKSLS